MIGARLAGLQLTAEHRGDAERCKEPIRRTNGAHALGILDAGEVVRVRVVVDLGGESGE